MQEIDPEKADLDEEKLEEVVEEQLEEGRKSKGDFEDFELPEDPDIEPFDPFDRRGL
ncbi:MAG: hypothetical protein MUP58_03445 [Candidatus Nanohaloarchaeota archaeon QJJ-9]|nr:hypothetical protein [Candidatus Nanohaloarchaeota archaeon QJJ-9]